MDLNKVMIIGRLTRDPEVRTTPNGASVASFSVATSFNWTDQQGQKKEQTEFHNVVAWRKLSEIVGQYLKKGSQVYIEGRLSTRSWDDKTSGQKRYRTEIVADSMIMLGRPSGSSVGSVPSTPMEQSAPADNLPEIQIDNSDIPF
jgi:single-strand DNA-binding protein